MKTLLSILLTCFIPNCPALASEGKPVETVPNVDLSKYVGEWKEIASIPQYFQRKCVGNTTARYEILDAETVRVLNSCDTAEGERTQSEGRARIVDAEIKAKLDVTFAKIFGKYIYMFGGKYWIIALDPDYKFAIVGHPTRKYGWILAREAALPPETLKALVQKLRDQGYDPCDFNLTPQTGGTKEKARLCDGVH